MKSFKTAFTNFHEKLEKKSFMFFGEIHLIAVVLIHYILILFYIVYVYPITNILKKI